MRTCTVCKKKSSNVLMNNRWICFHCDELLFDIEIETDETEVSNVPKTEPILVLAKTEIKKGP